MKYIFDRENIDPEVPGVMLLSHSELAVSLVHTVEFVCGETANLAAYSFEDTDTAEEFSAAFMDAYAALPAGSIVLVDIFGGSPSNQLMLQAQRSGIHMDALSGVSLPMVVSAINNRYMYAGRELINSIKEDSQDFIVDIGQCLER